MISSTPKPVILLAFANDKQGAGPGFLGGLTAERNGIREALRDAEDKGLCEVLVEPDLSIDRLFDLFQHPNYRNRIAIFHYGGHADSYELLLESADGAKSVAHAGGLVPFLARQQGLQLVFLNGCSSRPQALDLLQAGIPAVIGTSRTVDDGIATQLALRFYSGIAAGRSLESSWEDALDQIKTTRGSDLHRGARLPGKETVELTPPWELHLGQEAERIKEWNLPQAAQDPLFGLELPLQYYRRLPQKPFPGLRPYRQEEAAVFFGRAYEIRTLYTEISQGLCPLILMSGKTGAGKSSLLAAGLAPRLEASYRVIYQPYQQGSWINLLQQALEKLAEQLGIRPAQTAFQAATAEKIAALQNNLENTSGFAREVLETELHRLLEQQERPSSRSALWKRIGERSDKPVVVLLDQLDPLLSPAGPGADWPDFIQALNELLDSEGNTSGKILLACREENRAGLREALHRAGPPLAEYRLPTLNWGGIENVVGGLTLHPALRRQYSLQLKDQLSEISQELGNSLQKIIAEDFRESPESPVAPMLQFFLAGWWEKEIRESPQAPVFSVSAYQTLKNQGELFDRFFQQQLQLLREEQPEEVDSGLVFDLLYHHLSASGASVSLLPEQLEQWYGDRLPLLNSLLWRLKALFLLTDLEVRGTAIAHPFLIPAIAGAYSLSIRPGQQAARILNSYASRMQDPLDEADLAVLEAGMPGMRMLSAEEKSLLQISREQQARRERERRRNRLIRNTLGIIVALFAFLAGWQWQVSQTNLRESRSNELAFRAKDVFTTDNTLALYLAFQAFSLRARNPSPVVAQTLSEVYHSQAIRPFYEVRFSHKENVNSAVFSPDGEKVLTASEDGSAKLWKRNGELIRNFPHPGNFEVQQAVFTPAGNQLLTLSNQIVRLWDWNGDLIDSDSLPPGQEIDLDTFSSDGVRIFSPREETPTLLSNLRLENQQALSDPARRRLLLLSHDGVVRLCDGTGALLLDSLDQQVVYISFASDGKRFLSVSSAGDSAGTIRFWDWNGRALYGFSYPGVLTQAVFSPSGQQLLTASRDKTARLWDFSTPFLHRLPKHGRAVNSARFSPDGKQFLTASHDRQVRLWNEHGVLIDSFLHEGIVNSAVFSPDGRQVLSASRDYRAGLWWPQPGKRQWLAHEGEVNTACFSPDGKLIATASADSSAGVWSKEGRILFRLKHQGEVRSAQFSPDGSRILTLSSDSSAQVWSVKGNLLNTLRYRDELLTAVFSPNGEQILTCSADSSVQLWRSDGRLVQTLSFRHKVNLAVFSPNGKRLLIAGKNQVLIKDHKGRALDSLAHEGKINTITFSPDGRFLLTGSVDKTAKLWNWKGELLARYLQHRQSVNSACFSPDGKQVITAANDNSAILWRMPSAIFEELKKRPGYRLSPEEQALFENQ